MAENTGDMKSLRGRRVARADWLAERWDEITPRYQDDPNWLRQLATQLELWVGDELDNPLYLEVSYGPLAEEAASESGGFVPWNALNSDTLYLRALTKTQFVAVDVQKDGGQVAVASVSVVVVPRSHLESLQAHDMISLAGLQPDTIRLTLRYAGVPQSFLIPHADDYRDMDKWCTGNTFECLDSCATISGLRPRSLASPLSPSSKGRAVDPALRGLPSASGWAMLSGLRGAERVARLLAALLLLIASIWAVSTEGCSSPGGRVCSR